MLTHLAFLNRITLNLERISMTHRQIYNRAARLAKQHKSACDLLADIENKKFGFEFADTDSDRIIDTINYGIDSYDFDGYMEEMKFYKNSAKNNNENLKANGNFLIHNKLNTKEFENKFKNFKFP